MGSGLPPARPRNFQLRAGHSSRPNLDRPSPGRARGGRFAQNAGALPFGSPSQRGAGSIAPSRQPETHLRRAKMTQNRLSALFFPARDTIEALWNATPDAQPFFFGRLAWH